MVSNLNEEFLKYCKEDLWDKAILLLDQGADINAKDSDGKEALTYAIDSGSIHLISLLLSRGARSNMQTYYYQ